MTMTVYDAPNANRSWLTLQNPAIELANAIAGTEFVPVHFRNNPAAIAAAILYGDEVGLGPMQSLAKIAVINGRPTLAAEAQRALILQAGHDLWVEETTPTRCTVCGKRRGSEATSRITWTMDDAKRAGLTGKPPWKLYPRQMLLARASAELARAVFPDAIGGLASTEELDDGVAGVLEEAPTAPTSRRRRASVTVPPPTEEAEPTPPPDLPPTPTPPPTPPTPPTPELPGEGDGSDRGEWEAEGTLPEPEPMMISDGQRKKLQAMLRERAILDRTERLDLYTAQTGREISSGNELTFAEASALIDYLTTVPPPGGYASGQLVTPEQREALFALRLELGVTDARLREILQELTGQRVVSEIPADRYDAVVEAVKMEGAPFE